MYLPSFFWGIVAVIFAVEMVNGRSLQIVVALGEGLALFEFCVLGHIPGRIPNCDNVHPLQHYSAAPLGGQATSATI